MSAYWSVLADRNGPVAGAIRHMRERFQRRRGRSEQNAHMHGNESGESRGFSGDSRPAVDLVGE